MFSEAEIALVSKRCWELGISEATIPAILFQLDEAKRVSSIRKGGNKGKQQAIKHAQSAKEFPVKQKRHAKVAGVKLAIEVRRFERAIRKLVKRYQAKEISYRKLLSESEYEFRQSIEEAFRLGTKAVGLVTPTGQVPGPTTNERKWIDSYVQEELKYFEKFMSDVKRGLSKDKVWRRIELYANAIRSVYESGRVLAAGEDTLIYWVLESDDPCDDCQLIASNNPYTHDLLPTTPKGGSTRCRSNCYCTLRIQKATPDQIVRAKKGHKSAAWILKQIKLQQKQ